jgi:hypothetical protein
LVSILKKQRFTGKFLIIIIAWFRNFNGLVSSQLRYSRRYREDSSPELLKTKPAKKHVNFQALALMNINFTYAKVVLSYQRIIEASMRSFCNQSSWKIPGFSEEFAN